jgi:hypothetical protein
VTSTQNTEISLDLIARAPIRGTADLSEVLFPCIDTELFSVMSISETSIMHLVHEQDSWDVILSRAIIIVKYNVTKFG